MSKEIEITSWRPKINSEKWIEHARTTFAVDPRIAFSLGARFPTNSPLKMELTQLVLVAISIFILNVNIFSCFIWILKTQFFMLRSHILEIRTIPEALPYFVTPKAIDEDSPLLQQLTHWAACSITQTLEYLTPAYKGHPRVMAYILTVLESYPPSRVTFFMPQLIQALRYDDEKLVEGYLIRAAQRSNVFSHILICHLQVGMIAANDGIILRNHVPRILKKYFRVIAEFI